MKYLKYLLFGAAVLCLNRAVVAQSAIKGTISESQTGEPLPFAAIVNTSTGQGTATNFLGGFELMALENRDSLKISMVGYQELTVLAVNNLSIKMVPSVISLSEIVISTNREQELRAEAPVAIASISTATLEENKPTSIDQVLNQTPGVNMVNLGNEQHTMSIRRPIDYGASYLYMEDGVPIRTSGVFNHNALLEINMANVGKIEIVRGPASSIYGSEAIGGAVNFISKQPSLKPTAGVSIQGNNIGYKRTDFYASGTFRKKIGLRLGGYYANQRNGAVAYSDFNKLALSALVNFYVAENTELTWSHAVIDYYSDMSTSLDSARFYGKSYSSRYTFTYRKVSAYRTRLTLSHHWSSRSKTTVTGYFKANSIMQNPSYSIKDDPGNKKLAHGQVNDNSFNSFGLISQHKYDFQWMNSSVIGGVSVDVSPNTYTSDYIRVFKDDDGVYRSFTEPDSSLADYRANLMNTAGYVQAKTEPLKNLNIIAALRFDYFNYRFDNHLGANTYTAVLDGINVFSRFTPKVGLTYDLKNNRGLYANFSQGFVPPQVTNLYVGRKTPGLKPVYYDSYEVGGWVAFAREKAKLEVSLYRMDGLNEIISVQQDDGSTLPQNAGGTTHRGIEYAINALPHRDIKIRLSATYATHKFTDYVEKSGDLSGKNMPQAPRWMGNAQVTYRPSYLRGFRASAEWQHVNKYFTDPKNTKEYTGYNLLNMRAGYEWTMLEIWVNLLNATDQLYATVVRSSSFGQNYSVGSPRNFNIGIAYRFQ